MFHRILPTCHILPIKIDIISHFDCVPIIFIFLLSAKRSHLNPTCQVGTSHIPLYGTLCTLDLIVAKENGTLGGILGTRSVAVSLLCRRQKQSTARSWQSKTTHSRLQFSCGSFFALSYKESSPPIDHGKPKLPTPDFARLRHHVIKYRHQQFTIAIYYQDRLIAQLIKYHHQLQ